MTVDVLGNDVVPIGTDPNLKLAGAGVEGLSAQARLTGRRGPVIVTAPPATGRPAVALYSVDNGLAPPSVAKITVRSIAGFNNPHRAMDVEARPPSGAKRYV